MLKPLVVFSTAPIATDVVAGFVVAMMLFQAVVGLGGIVIGTSGILRRWLRLAA
jgi:hypothetical protein